MTGIVAALHAVVIIRGYSRICGEISRGDAHRHAELAAQVVGDDPLVGGVGVAVDEADADGFDVRGAQLGSAMRVERSAVGGASTTAPCGDGALGDLERPGRAGTGGAGNSICRSYMS